MISVCIATYNGEKYIRQQLDSILCQIGEEDEVIVSDDFSQDKTLEIVRSFDDKRIKIIQNKGLKGYAPNFENALNNAQGDIIFLSDQDDVWLPNKVSAMFPFLQQDNLVVCNVLVTDGDLNKSATLKEWQPYKKGILRNLYKNTYFGCTLAFTKKIKDYCLPIPKNVVGHDIWFGLLSELKFKVVYIKEPLMLYRRHNNNTSRHLPFFSMLKVRFIYFTEIIKWILKN